MVNDKITPPHQLGSLRIKWVDAAKALGIILVFWGHILDGDIPIQGDIRKVIYSFHMPMYFILSGYVFKTKALSFREYVNNRFKKILLPALIVYAFTFPIVFLPHFADYPNSTVWTFIEKVFYLKGQLAYNSPIWFFICIFQILIFAKWLNLSNQRTRVLIMICVSCLILSYMMYNSKFEMANIFGFNKFILGLFFFVVGILLRKLQYEGKIMHIIGLLSIPIWIISCFANIRISMYGMSLGNIWLFVISGISGSLVFYMVCRLFEKYSFIRRYATWMVFIVSTHLLLANAFGLLAPMAFSEDSYLYLSLCFVFVLLALLIYAPVCKYLEKRIPVLFGK